MKSFMNRITIASGICGVFGRWHYQDAHVLVLKKKSAANPWHFPPVVMREARLFLAYDGIQEGDVVLYPGVLRAEIVSSLDGQ